MLTAAVLCRRPTQIRSIAGATNVVGLKQSGREAIFSAAVPHRVPSLKRCNAWKRFSRNSGAKRVFALRRFPVEGFRFGIALAHAVEGGDRGLSNVEKTRRRIFAEGQQKLRALVRTLRHSRRDQRGKNRRGLHVSEHA